MSRHPAIMGRVLAEHNDVLRSCKWECCGYTAEVEGDSMVLLFHEAADAAAFCLQVLREGGGLGGWRVTPCCCSSTRQPMRQHSACR